MTASTWPPAHAFRPDAGHHRHRAAPSRRPRALAAAGAVLAGAVWVGAVSEPTSDETLTASMTTVAWASEMRAMP